jgi:hypothetical protein
MDEDEYVKAGMDGYNAEDRDEGRRHNESERWPA